MFGLWVTAVGGRRTHRGLVVAGSRREGGGRRETERLREDEDEAVYVVSMYVLGD